MNLSATIVVMLVVGVAAILFACRILFRQALSGALFKVLLGLLLVAVSLTLAFSALDLLTYRKLLDEQQIATLKFEQIQPQRFKVVVVDAAGNVYHHYLHGDDWQLDARILRWHSSLAALGLANNYRLDRLSGRYRDITREVNSEKTVFQLVESYSPLDLWTLVQQLPIPHHWLDASYGSATYLPMADDAAYQVTLSYSGLVARPINKRAESAVKEWRNES